MPDTKAEQLYIANAFWLEIDSVKLAKITEVSGLETTTDHTEVTQQMKDGKTWISRVPARHVNKPGTLTMKTKSVEGAADMWKWRKQVVDGKINDARRNGSIIIYDSTDQEIGRWNFTGAWPSKMSVGALSAGSNDAVDIEMTVEYDSLTPAAQ
ncbi:MAG TPA: phage tail protein [Acidimicrobiia bacterium]|jgi:phage tail-like protein